MKIICERDKILAAFQVAASVTPTRSPKPILQSTKLEVTEDTAIFTATNLEIGVRIEFTGVEVEAAGNAILPVGQFGSILRESTDEKLYIETNAQGTVVKGERSEFKLPSENPEEFPAVSAFQEEKYHEVPARLLKELIRRTLFATDTESSRYALGGVLLELSEDKITAVGTDGRRLAKMEGPAHSVGKQINSEAQTIAPTQSMQLIERALSDDDAEIQIAARSNDLLVKSQRAMVYTRLVEGRFPKWQEVIPDWQDAIAIEMTVGPLLSAIRQAAIVASDESRGIDFSFSEGLLELSGSTAEIGEAHVKVPISYSGSPLTITLDHRFVTDFLKVLAVDKVFTLRLKDAESAAFWQTDDGYSYVVMPLAKDR